MFKYIKNMNKITLYIISIILLYIFLIITSIIFKPEEKLYTFKNYEYKKMNIIENKENYEINVNYPRFYKEKLSSYITNYLYNYINEFKNQSKKTNKKEKLTINYEIETLDKVNLINVFFRIDNTLNISNTYKSILLDPEKFLEKTIEDIYGESILNEIKELIHKKYSGEIYDSIQNFTIKDFNYSFKENYINIYVNNSLIKSPLNYNIYVTKLLNEKYVFEEIESENQKYIALTFDDGPSQYTKDIIDTIYLNNSSATFFVLGNRMKVFPEIVRYAGEKGMEIASHSYSHKNLTLINEKDVLKEINSVTILYNEITGKNITFLRPPYGAVNERLKNLSIFPLIKWSIDPKDWINRDAEYIKNHILEHAYDGGIIIIHDIYSTTLESIKLTLPELENLGYKVVSVSRLAEIKGKTLLPGEVIKEIK